MCGFEFSQLRGQNLFTDIFKQPSQFAETSCPVGEMPDDLHLPFTRDGVCGGLYWTSKMAFQGGSLLLRGPYKFVRTSAALVAMLPSVADVAEENSVPTHLTPEEMKRRVLEHFEDFVNRREAEVIQRNMDVTFVDHDGPQGKPVGIAGDEAMMRSMYEKMPDLRIEVLDCLAQGDKVACRNIWRWKDSTSGQPMQFHGFVLWRFEGDKIAERWATVTSPSLGSDWSQKSDEGAI